MTVYQYLYNCWIQGYFDNCSLRILGGIRDNEVYKYVISLHSSGLNDVNTQHQSFIKNYHKSVKKIKLSGFDSHD